MAKRFQFSLKSLLSAAFWLSVSFGAFSVLRNLRDYDVQAWPYGSESAFIILMLSLTIVSPFIAVGALFGRTISAFFAAGISISLLVFLLLHYVR
jgi:hypothetical protein